MKSAREDDPAPVSIETEPGDVIVFDEHLMHGSVGGAHRRQWRVDFTADQQDDREELLLLTSFAHIFDVGWDGGYDVDRYPSYGDAWQKAHPQWARRLRDLGVIELARGHEAAMRSRECVEHLPALIEFVALALRVS